MDPNGPGWLGFLPLFFVVFFVALVAGIPFWKICGRTGLSKGLVAVLFVPVFGWLILIWIIAFSNWPSERSDNLLK